MFVWAGLWGGKGSRRRSEAPRGWDPRVFAGCIRSCCSGRVVAAMLYVVCGWMLHDPQRHHQGHPPSWLGKRRWCNEILFHGPGGHHWCRARPSRPGRGPATKATNLVYFPNRTVLLSCASRDAPSVASVDDDVVQKRNTAKKPTHHFFLAFADVMGSIAT
ncbi:hypothetical protein F4809DRAFT_566074 [Biscogniauxia mediterranea]|nr:hypothetical protein F4809DRAFT_566074 [Biscogniauxia mediterranea]